MCDGSKIHDDANDAKLKVLVDDLEASDHRLILRSKNTGSRLSVQNTTVTGTVLAAAEICGFSAHIMMLPPLTFKKCDGYSTSFYVRNGLSCIHGGLVISRHNEVRDKLLYLARRALPPSMRTM